VIFSREISRDPDAAASPNPAAPASPNPAAPASPNPAAPAPRPALSKEEDALAVTDAERDALTFTAYDLDVHLTPADAGISVRAGLTVRNDGAVPLGRLVFEISSSLRWEAFSSADLAPPTTAAAALRLDFKARRVATDADHTGWVAEAVVALPRPLAPGGSLALIALYSGTIAQSGERLERIGAPADRAADADWDSISAGGTALRGFGEVLWYPVAAAPVFLGDGAKLFEAVGRSKRRQSPATVRLRLAVEYTGDPPDAAFFGDRREPLAVHSDNADLPVAESTGVATVVFEAQPLGFRSPSLFVTDHGPSQVDPSSARSGALPDAGLIAAGLICAVTDHYDALPAYSAAAALVDPLLADWFGVRPLTVLNLLDHPGQPFEDDTLLVRPMRVEEPAALAPSLAHSLTHAWIHSRQPWIDEGLAQFAGLLWTERSVGRGAALAELQDAANALAFAEPAAPAPDPADGDANASGPGQTLVAATGEIYYRGKAAAVWWMLRGIAGDEALKEALQAYRLDPRLDGDPEGFERTLEKFAHKDLRWFFDDWVYRDRGLPDLSIVNVTPRQLEAHNGRPAGWLVAVEVRNDGYAAAEVPVTVRAIAGRDVATGAGAATDTQRLRVPGRSSVSTRIVFAGTPGEVQVNDGGVPETRASVHTRQLALPLELR
jgi:hypothetical protein